MRKGSKNFLCLAMVVTLMASLTACSSKSNKNDSQVNKPNTSTESTNSELNGTFEGTGTGKMGDIKVSVAFENGTIKEVKVVDQSETPGIADPALKDIPEAIAKHQSVAVDTIAGATMTSNGILDAVKAAIKAAGANVSDYEKEVVTEAGETKEVEADIVVVGAGGAGLMAAYNATKEGANVVILEKGASAAVSNFALCGGPAAVNTYIQEKENATVTVDQLYGHFYEFAKGTVNAKALKESVIGSGEAVNTLDNLGIEMILMEDTYGVGYRARHFFSKEGMERIEPLIKKIEEQGGTFYYGTAGEHIIMEDGKAVGVQAKQNDGTIVNVKAKAVLIATGGYLGSKEMIQQVFGDINLVTFGNVLSTADGINMVLEAGGRLDNNFALLGNEFGGANSKMQDPTFTPEWTLGNDNLIYWITGGLIVNQSGDRFINEKLIADTPLATGGQAIAQEGKAYAIIDQKYYEANYNGGIFEYMGYPENWKSGDVLVPTDASKADEYLEKAISEGWGFKADSIAELAEYFGLENLEETVKNYNEMCKTGKDTEFGKDSNFMIPVEEGPYYVFEYEPSAWGTNGGVKVDSHLRALTKANEVIEGLYVAGVDAGSIYASPYYDSEGASIGLALGSGVYAAEEMLEFIRK